LLAAEPLAPALAAGPLALADGLFAADLAVAPVWRPRPFERSVTAGSDHDLYSDAKVLEPGARIGSVTTRSRASRRGTAEFLAARLDSMARRLLDAASFVGCRVLDQGDQAVGDEPPGPYRLPGAGDLAHFNDPARRHDLDSPARAGRDDLERLHTLASVDDGLDPIAFHRRTRSFMRAR
jgi:hypothetical protein